MNDFSKETGFQNLKFYQIFTKPALMEIEQPQPGHGKGSFVVVEAKKYKKTIWEFFRRI